MFEISVHNQLERDPICKETNINYFNKVQTHALSKSTRKRIKQVHTWPMNYHLKQPMFPGQRVCKYQRVCQISLFTVIKSIYILKN